MYIPMNMTLYGEKLRCKVLIVSYMVPWYVLAHMNHHTSFMVQLYSMCMCISYPLTQMNLKLNLISLGLTRQLARLKKEEKQFGRFAAVWLGTFAMLSRAIRSLVGHENTRR